MRTEALGSPRYHAASAIVMLTSYPLLPRREQGGARPLWLPGWPQRFTVDIADTAEEFLMKRALCSTLAWGALALASAATPLPPQHQPGSATMSVASLTTASVKAQQPGVDSVKVSANQALAPAAQAAPASAGRSDQAAAPASSAWQRYGPWLAALGVMLTIALRRARSEKR